MAKLKFLKQFPLVTSISFLILSLISTFLLVLKSITELSILIWIVIFLAIIFISCLSIIIYYDSEVKTTNKELCEFKNTFHDILKISNLDSSNTHEFNLSEVKDKILNISTLQNRIEQLAEISKFIVWEVNLNERKLRIIPEFSDISELNGKFNLPSDFFWKVLHPDDKQRVKNIIENVIPNKGSEIFSFRVIMNKKVKYYHTNCSIINDKNNKDILLGTSVDITETIESQNLLQKSQTDYQNLLDNIPISLIMHSEFKIFYANEEAVKTLKYDTKNDLIGKHPQEIIHPDNRADVLKKIKQVYAGMDLPKTVTSKFLTKKNEAIITEVVGKSIEFNSKNCSQIMFKDITEKYKVEEDLHFTHQIYHKAIENAQGVPYLLNYDTKEYDFIGEGVKNLFDLDSNSVLRKDLLNRIWRHNPNLKDKYSVQDYEQKFREGAIEKYQADFTIKDRNGNLRWISDYAVPIKNNNGKVTGSLGILQNITERKHIELELEKEKEKAQKSEANKTQFFTHMSHEIKSPLHSIMSVLGLLDNELTSNFPEDLKESILIAKNSGKRIAKTVEQILQISRLKSGKYRANYKIHCLKQLLEREIEEQLIFANEKGLNLNFNSKLHNPNVLVDEFSTRQVISNLIGNAIKYTNEGSVNITISNGYKNKIICIIEDTGIGINEGFLKEIFDEFKQEYIGIKRKYEGNGLGLAIVKKFCEINQIEINVESKKGKGTKFILSFEKLKN